MTSGRLNWRRLFFWAAFAGFFFINPRLARATLKEGEWFSLRIDPCVPVDPEVVAQQLTLELRPLQDRTRPAAGPIKLSVSCQGVQTLLQAHSMASGLLLLRAMLLTLEPSEVKERILALTLAELLAASAGEDETESPRDGEGQDPAAPRRLAEEPSRTSSPGSSPAQLSPSVPSGRPRGLTLPGHTEDGRFSPRQFPSLRVLALTTGQAIVNGPLLLWGGGVGFGWDGSRHFGLFVDLLGRHGSVGLDVGTVSADTVSLGVTPLLWYGPSYLHLRIGTGLRGGLVRLQGEPIDSTKTQGAIFVGGWLGPVLNLGITANLSQRVALEVTTEGGYVVLPVIGKAGGMPAAAIAGPFLGLNLGVGIFP